MSSCVAKCEACGEQRIVGEWGKCKPCFEKWFQDQLLWPDPDRMGNVDTPNPAKAQDALNRLIRKHLITKHLPIISL